MKKLFLLLLSVCSIASASLAQPSLAPQLDSLLSAYQTVHGFSGHVMVVQQNQTVFAQSYGLANREFQVPYTANTRSSINSISKTFTAVATLQLAQAGQLNLHTPISHYLPSLKAPWASQVSTHHLLSHTSGLPREAGLQWHHSLSFAEQQAMVEALQLLFTPGERYEYSNAGFILLGCLLEAVTGKSYAEVIESQIISPLGLPNTGVYQGNTLVTRQATPYAFGPQGVQQMPRTKTMGPSAGGGLYSTASDLYAFVNALEGDALLNAQYRKLLFTPHTPEEGYAFSIQEFDNKPLYMAAGSGDGTKSTLLIVPHQQTYVFILANWGNTPVLKMLLGAFFLTQGMEAEVPQSSNLAQPSHYTAQLGTYRFNELEMKTHLQAETNVVVLQALDGRLFLDSDVLVQGPDGTLYLTYTEELAITFPDPNHMTLVINGNKLTGERVK